MNSGESNSGESNSGESNDGVGTDAGIAVCFVCLGNICRSPAAEAVFRSVVSAEGLQDVITIDSAGTAGYHVGEPPDHRTLSEARKRDYPLHHAARRFTADDFDRFHLVIAMDSANLADLRRMAPDAPARAKIHLLRSFDPAAPTPADVGDPYYGTQRDFATVFDQCEQACPGLLKHAMSLLL